jgi:GNAT superfamily N-acetyltransferase
VTIRAVPIDDPTAATLWAEQQAELFARYGEPDADADFALDMPPDALVTSLVAITEDGEPVGTGLLRWSPFDSGAGSAEVKRLYVRPQFRGQGISREIMAGVEAAALRAGAVRLVLETGVEQPEALSLYESMGYDRIQPYGEYMDDPRSVCFGKELPTRVLVVNGSIGAGKTKTAGAVFDVLSARGVRCAMIDGDYLCQASPDAPGAPFNQGLYFQNLAAVAPVYRSAGYGVMVLARVVEDPEDRDRYARAFGTELVTIARVTAPEEERKSRIVQRDIEPEWQQWGHARTIELHAVLEELQLDDVVVSNSGRSPVETAEELLALLGW